MTEPQPNASTVHSYARRLSFRLLWVHALRGLCLAAGAAALCIVLAASLAEPVLTRTGAIWTWCVVGVTAGLALLWGLSPLRRYRGARISQLVAGADPALAQRLRSALELSSAQRDLPGMSEELLRAHLADVKQSLAKLPAQTIVPWSRVLHVSLLLGMSGVATFAWLDARDGGVRAFVQALIAPARERQDGVRIAPVIAQLRVRLLYPSYLGRAPSWVDDAKEFAVPAGTTLELHVTPRFRVERGRAVAGSRSVALNAAADGQLVGQLNLQAESEVHIEVSKNSVRYEDPQTLKVNVTPDANPSISLDAPRTGTLAPPGEIISLRYTANDDVGVGTIQLHARVEGRPERQRVIFSAVDDGGPQRNLQSGAELTPEELGAAEGDTLVVWLEARDTDLTNGPHLGRSQDVALEVVQPGQGLSEYLPLLQQIADGAVDVLAQRLEAAVSREVTPARSRFEALQRGERAWLSQVDGLVRSIERSGASTLDADQMRGLRRRHERLLTSESALHFPQVRSYGERAEADARTLDELERDVVLLADMLARAHVDEAKALANELRGLKHHIEELIAQLGKTHSPEAEHELMREIAKAQRRLAELAQSLSRMATHVPSEFVNRDAVQQQAAESSLASLQRAVQDHDLRSAAQHLENLAKQIDELAAQISEGGLRLQESRFGPRDQALAQARQKLDMLGSEQSRLASRSADVMRNALDRGQHGSNEQRAQALAPRADALSRAADELDQGSGNSLQSSAANRAAERARDARDALRTGDLAQARGMAQSAERSLRDAADELESEARMYPGGNGEAAQRAARARQAATDAERLTDDIDRAMPELAERLNDGERQRLRTDAEDQGRTAEAADQLKDSFDKGPDGLPLSPDASETLEGVRKSMQRAQRALERGRPEEANREQQQAADRLQKLSQALAEQQRSSGRGNRGGAGQNSGANGANSDAHVHIPGTEEWKSPTELRRRLLDAMRESGPSGYEAAIKRYYQELMR